MKPTKFSMILGLLLFLAVVVSPGITAAGDAAVTIHGYVLDSACAFTKHLKKPARPERERPPDEVCRKAGHRLRNGLFAGWLFGSGDSTYSSGLRRIKRRAVATHARETGG